MNEHKPSYVSVGSLYEKEEIEALCSIIPANFPKKIAITIPLSSASLNGRVSHEDRYDLSPALRGVRRLLVDDQRVFNMADIVARESYLSDGEGGYYSPYEYMSRIVDAAGDNLHAVILDKLWPKPMSLIRFCLSTRRKYLVVLRVTIESLCNMRWPAYALRSKFEQYAEIVDYVIFEAGKSCFVRGREDFEKYIELMECLVGYGIRIGMQHPLQEDMSLLEAFATRFPQECIEFTPRTLGKRTVLQREEFHAQCLDFAQSLLLCAPRLAL